MEELLRQPPVISPPLMNAAGTLGFAPDPRSPLDWAQFGAFVTNPISQKPRKPAARHRWQTSAAGVMLHSGHPNPGFRRVLQTYAPRWAQADLPVIVHLLADTPAIIHRQVLHLEELENILAVEIGFPENIVENEITEVLTAAQGELPVFARLPLMQVVPLAKPALESGASAVSLAPPRGTIFQHGIFSAGRLYGAELLPMQIQVVLQLDEMDIPVVASGHLTHPSQVEPFQQAGAFAVQVDISLWRGDWFNQKEK
jgi:dihydroorotate dehydrogenase